MNKNHVKSGRTGAVVGQAGETIKWGFRQILTQINVVDERMCTTVILGATRRESANIAPSHSLSVGHLRIGSPEVPSRKKLKARTTFVLPGILRFSASLPGGVIMTLRS